MVLYQLRRKGGEGGRDGGKGGGREGGRGGRMEGRMEGRRERSEGGRREEGRRLCHTKERGQRMAHLGRQLDLHGWLGWPVAHREDIDIQLYVARDLVTRHLGREAREGRREGKREGGERKRELEEREEEVSVSGEWISQHQKRHSF